MRGSRTSKDFPPFPLRFGSKSFPDRIRSTKLARENFLFFRDTSTFSPPPSRLMPRPASSSTKEPNPLADGQSVREPGCQIGPFKGNTSPELREHLSWLARYPSTRSTFAKDIWRRATITEVDVDTYESGAQDGKGKGKTKEVVRMVHELDVTEGECACILHGS
jgi:hypothetical protein